MRKSWFSLCLAQAIGSIASNLCHGPNCLSHGIEIGQNNINHFFQLNNCEIEQLRHLDFYAQNADAKACKIVIDIVNTNCNLAREIRNDNTRHEIIKTIQELKNNTDVNEAMKKRLNDVKTIAEWYEKAKELYNIS